MTDIDWRYTTYGIKNRIIYLYQSLEGSDCEFVVGEEKEVLKAHKFILSMASPVFDKMFNGKLNEGNAVIVPDTKPRSFVSLLKYIYTDEVEIKGTDEAFSLYYLVDKYMLPDCSKQCTDYIQNNIKTSNVCQVYEFSKLFNIFGLMESCKQVIINKTTEVINDSNFGNTQKETLLMIMEQNSLNITSELVLYHAVMKWALAETIRKDMNDKEQLMSLYEEMLTKIRFLTMELVEFAEGPAICEYISAEDARDILINLSSSKSKRNYPEKYKVPNWDKCRCKITQTPKVNGSNYGFTQNHIYQNSIFAPPPSHHQRSTSHIAHFHS